MQTLSISIPDSSIHVKGNTIIISYNKEAWYCKIIDIKPEELIVKLLNKCGDLFTN